MTILCSNITAQNTPLNGYQNAILTFCKSLFGFYFHLYPMIKKHFGILSEFHLEN